VSISITSGRQDEATAWVHFQINIMKVRNWAMIRQLISVTSGPMTSRDLERSRPWYRYIWAYIWTSLRDSVTIYGAPIGNGVCEIELSRDLDLAATGHMLHPMERIVVSGKLKLIRIRSLFTKGRKQLSHVLSSWRRELFRKQIAGATIAKLVENDSKICDVPFVVWSRN